MTTQNNASKYIDLKIGLLFGNEKKRITQECLPFVARYDKESKDFIKPIHILIKNFLDTIDKKFLMSRTYCKPLLSRNREKISYFFDGTLETLLMDVDINVQSYIKTLDNQNSKKDCIYGIQTLASFDASESRVRNVGWHKTLREAYLSLLTNSGVLSEEADNIPYYKYALIEEIPVGLFGTDTNDDNSCLFFEYNTKKKRYVNIDTPESCKGIVGFIIG